MRRGRTHALTLRVGDSKMESWVRSAVNPEHDVRTRFREGRGRRLKALLLHPRCLYYERVRRTLWSLPCINALHTSYLFRAAPVLYIVVV
jgi:hypothetical protein